MVWRSEGKLSATVASISSSDSAATNIVGLRRDEEGREEKPILLELVGSRSRLRELKWTTVVGLK